MAYGALILDELRLIEAQLHITYGIEFVVERAVKDDMLLVSWINTHGNQQQYKLEICSLDRGFRVLPKSLNGLIAMVKMTT